MYETVHGIVRTNLVEASVGRSEGTEKGVKDGCMGGGAEETSDSHAEILQSSLQGELVQESGDTSIDLTGNDLSVYVGTAAGTP